MNTEGSTQFDGYMQLSSDGQSMEIFKKVPLKKMYVKSADDNFIKSEKIRLKYERIQRMYYDGHRENDVEDEQELGHSIKESKVAI